MNNFNFCKTPSFYFGPKQFQQLPAIVSGIVESSGEGKRAVFFTGESSLKGTERWAAFEAELQDSGYDYRIFPVADEPSPELVDKAVSELTDFAPAVVCSIGGGSVIDAGKAVSAMLPVGGSVVEYLEGVGSKQSPGKKVPFIAVPTTSGTGSEATKNAVISRRGEGGFKKSLRHDNYVPDYAVVDPELVLSCPRITTAASGMDAITQLIEGFVSANSSPMTDGLAMSGLAAAGISYQQTVENGDTDIEARYRMAYAASMSGIVLANAGLGIVHGIAGYLGGRFDIPHGIACGTILSAATEIIINKLFDLEEENNVALQKYGEAGKYLTGADYGGVEANCEALVQRLASWTEGLGIPRLGEYGITADNLPEIAAKSGRKNTPVEITDDDCIEICSHRL